MLMKISLLALILMSLSSAQTQRLIINSFNNGPSTASINALGLAQGASGAGQISVNQGRLAISTLANQPTTIYSKLSSPNLGCLPIPPQKNIDTMLTFRMQAPPGLDMSIVLQTGTSGCGGSANNSAVVRLSSYNNLDGDVAWVHIPLLDFDYTASYLDGRIRAVVFQIPAIPWPALIQFDDMQLVSRPRIQPLWDMQFQEWGMQMLSGPPQGNWNTPRSDSRCGPGFGWAGCAQGECCSSRGWCGSTPMHCLSTNGLFAISGAPLRWNAPRSDSRCGRSFGWAGCHMGESCSQAGWCGSTPEHFINSQVLPQ
jgi:hypothetical protein